MSKRYRYIKLTPNELCYWANNFKLSVVSIGNRGATKLDMHRVKSLAACGLPFPPIVLAEYLVEVSRCLWGRDCFSYFVLYRFHFGEGKGYTTV